MGRGRGVRFLLIAVCLLFAAGGPPVRADQDPVYELLFIHHSVGENWVNDHLGAGLAGLDWVELHSAGDANEIAWATDVCNWYPKFSTQLDLIFTFDHSPDTYYTDDRQNDIIVFKSCFPAADIVGRGEEPGDPSDCTKTMANYRAAYRACAAIFAQHPEKLFIPLTIPPRSYWDTEADPASEMALTREFTQWLKGEYVSWYQATYGRSNVVVFDAFDILAWGPQGEHPNYLRYEFLNSYPDSHPNPAGNHALTYGYTDPDDGRVFQGFLAFLEAAAAGGSGGDWAAVCDLDTSGRVDGMDLALFGPRYGASAGEGRFWAAADFDGSGTIDGADLAILASCFGDHT